MAGLSAAGLGQFVQSRMAGKARRMALGCAITVPVILAYTVFAYRVFWGKAGDLRYG